MKNCVVFNDLSGYGNCSLMAAVPVLTVMGVRVHPVPTAVLTRQTGYDRYSMEDLTGFMPQFTADWQEVQPDGIITGFLSNPVQGDCIADFLAVHRTADTLLVVDPVMADDGSLYDGFDEARCNAVRRLAAQADVLTPNVSELALLCGAEYTEDPAANGRPLGRGSPGGGGHRLSAGNGDPHPGVCRRGLHGLGSTLAPRFL